MNTVTGYGDGFVEINKVRFNHAIAFGPLGEIARWSAQSSLDISTDLLLAAARLSLAPLDPMAFLDSDETGARQVLGDKPVNGATNTAANPANAPPSAHVKPAKRSGLQPSV